MEKLPLLTKNRNHFRIDNGRLDLIKRDLDSFLVGQDYMLSKKFANDVLFTHEVKFNNAVEEYNDDVGLIEKTISNPRRKNLTEQERRIMNLYKGYRYISGEEKEINKDNLKKLYDILSSKLLSEDDLEHMGEYYRDNPVYIFFSDNINTPPDEGIDAEEVEFYMNQLFSFINGKSVDDLTDHYIKSQIMHFYFVYIHPYFDINGRTSRTMSLWYLLNNECYPYIIFNRGISLQKNSYYKVIRKSKSSSDITPFLEYMLKTVLTELQKEYIIHHFHELHNLTNIEHQTLQYILSLNGLKTASDFSKFYNLHNEKKRPKEIVEKMIMPLMDKGILSFERYSSSCMYGNEHNFLFDLNLNNLDIEKEKVKALKL